MQELNISLQDLQAFADLGTIVHQAGDSYFLTRDGISISVLITNNELQVNVDGQKTRRFSSLRSLLASEQFADLSRIATNQSIVLRKQKIEGDPVPVNLKLVPMQGIVPPLGQLGRPWDDLNLWLTQMMRSQVEGSTDLLLINGPAGVGKTTIVREAALRRAEDFDGTSPLLLQIASRGRVLQNISDLIAFSLQEIRSNITISQLMVLMKHGLFVLAIDGFDELSDPNGFETAWSGLNSLIDSVRGRATFLLAGRETFISTDTMLKQLRSIKSNDDRFAVLTLSDTDPDSAKSWLLKQEGWSYELLELDFIEPIFEPNSYALRPFFLWLISKEPQALRSDSPPATDLLSYLISVMARREAEKFVDVLDPPNEEDAARRYEAYVIRFLEEIARDLAENQSESIADDALDLLARVAAEGILPPDQIAAVIQRARTVVFLSNDLHAGHVRFAHEQLLQHFLSREALRSVGEGEVPRYIRRNLFGREALEVFANVAKADVIRSEIFLREVRRNLQSPSRDRTNTNLASLGVAGVCGAALEDSDLVIRDIGINELLFPFDAPSGISFFGSAISILYATGVDISRVKFHDDVHVATIEIDQRSVLPLSMPTPQLVVRDHVTYSDPREVSGAIGRGLGVDETTRPQIDHDVVDLLGRIERYKTFWLRTKIDDTDPQGRKIISHDKWPIVYESLKLCELVTVKTRQAAGTFADFVHFRSDVEFTQHERLLQTISELS